MIADRIRSIQAVSGGGGGGGFDPSQLSGLKLWLKADTGVTVDGSGNVSSWADQSGNGNTAYQTDAAKYPVLSATYAVNGVPAVVAQNDQFLQLTQNLAGQHSTTPFTMIWVGTKTNSTAGTTVAEALTSSGGIRYLATTTSFQAFLGNVAAINYGVGKGLLNPNAHFARMDYPNYKVECTQGSSVVQNVSYNGVANFARLFIGPTYNLTNPGYALNEVMLLDRSINDAELADIKAYIKTRYNLYTSDSLILNMQGTPGGTTFTDESPNALTVTPYGDAVLVSDATYGTVASFDGAGDYLSLAGNSSFQFGTGDYTVETWVYINANASAQQTIVDTRGAASASPITFGLYQSSLMLYDGGVRQTSGITLTENQWYHFAASRSNGVLKLFVNGTSYYSASNTVNISTGANSIYLARGFDSSGFYFNGLIGPLRIAKKAYYTANFTPPTGLFPTS